MKRISKDELASLIHIGRLKDFVVDKVDELPIIHNKKEVGTTRSVCRIVKTTLIVVGVLAAVGAAAFAVYRIFFKDYDEYDDFDDFDDDFDDDFFDDDDIDEE